MNEIVNKQRQSIMYNALDQISNYQSVDDLQQNCWEDWGLDDPNDAIMMAYENVIETAKRAIEKVDKLQ